MKSALLFAATLGTIFAQTSSASASGPLSGIVKSRREGDTPEFLPTANVAMGMGPGRDVGLYGNFWLGVSHYPLSQSWSPFYSAGAELDLRSLRDDRGNTKTVAVFGPQVRGGISYFPDNNGYLSLFNAYGFVGYRVPSAFESHVFRFGIGVSSPGVGIALLAGNLTLPWMIEGAFDASERGVTPSVRFGFSY